MESNERIRFLRALTTYTQRDVANELGITPANYGHIETGRIGLRMAYEHELAKILGVNSDWLQNGPEYPIVEKPILFIELPPKREAKRKIFEVVDSLRQYLGEFINENSADKIYYTEELSDVEKVYILPLYHGKLMIIKASDYSTIVNSIEQELAKQNVTQQSLRKIAIEEFQNLSSNGSILEDFVKSRGYASQKISKPDADHHGSKKEKKETEATKDIKSESLEMDLLEHLKIIICKLETLEKRMDELEKRRLK